MLPVIPAMTLDSLVTSVLAALSQAGTVLTICICVTAVALATRCKGCCREDSIFRSHVV
jgi:hypothetical protein